MKTGDIVQVQGLLCGDNDVGGTKIFTFKQAKIRLSRSFNDYECGVRCIGNFVDEKDIAKSRKEGKTGQKPSGKYDPSIVYFSGMDIVTN